MGRTSQHITQIAPENKINQTQKKKNRSKKKASSQDYFYSRLSQTLCKIHKKYPIKFKLINLTRITEILSILCLCHKTKRSREPNILETFEILWWRGGGSNSRPLHCERSALPAELPPHTEDRRLASSSNCRRRSMPELFEKSKGPAKKSLSLARVQWSSTRFGEEILCLSLPCESPL